MRTIRNIGRLLRVSRNVGYKVIGEWEDCGFSYVSDDDKHYKDYQCTVCKNTATTKPVDHSWEIGSYVKNGSAKHKVNSKCVCGATKSELKTHTYDESTGVCTECKYECQHNFSGGGTFVLYADTRK